MFVFVNKVIYYSQSTDIEPEETCLLILTLTPSCLSSTLGRDGFLLRSAQGDEGEWADTIISHIKAVAQKHGLYPQFPAQAN